MEPLRTKEDFSKFVDNFKLKNKMPYAYALGTGFHDEKGDLIATRWLNISIEQNLGFLSVLMDKMLALQGGIEKVTLIDVIDTEAEILIEDYFTPFLGEVGHTNLEILKLGVEGKKHLSVIIYPNKESLTKGAPVSAIDVLCRLTMISLLQFKPNELNLDGAFGLLNRLYYTTEGAMTEVQWKAKFMEGNCTQPIAIDKFPPLWWGAPLPENVRIADPARVRLGAYLSPGTTIMHEGFCNFNAGTLGSCMIEGRISASVTIGKDSDIGGGASIMGTLSGGGKEKITIEENCLLGANSGIGISLGDRCTVEAGLYITAGTIVVIRSSCFGAKGGYIKAIDLSGKDDMLFRRNSTNGGIELLFNENPNKLNKILH